MKIISLALLCAFLIPSCILAGVNQPFQAHGFNELDYFAQLLIKGLDFYKMDISLADYDTCKKYSTWKDGDNECEFLDNFKMCCLAFRGDISSAPVMTDHFNTTNEMLVFLNDTKYDFIWFPTSSYYTKNRTIHLAFNFQYGHPQAKLTYNFMHDIVQVLKRRNIPLHLITGTDSFVNYYDKKCQKNCTEGEKVIVDYDWILQSSGSKYAPRVRNYNAPFGDVVARCKNGFPEWDYAIPYTLYEPSHEDDTKLVTSEYFAKSCNMPANRKNFEKLRITTNQDPEMMNLWLSEYTHATNASTIRTVLTQNSSAPLVAYNQTLNVMYYMYQDSKSNIVLEVRNMTGDRFLDTVSTVKFSSDVTAYSLSAKELLFMSGKNEYRLWNASQSDNLESICSVIDASVNVFAREYVRRNDTNVIIKIETPRAEDKCAANSLVLSWYDIDTTNNCQEKRQFFFCLPFGIQSGVSVENIAAANSSLSFELDQLKQEHLFGIFTFSVFNAQSSLYEIHAVTLNFTFNTMLALDPVGLNSSYVDLGHSPQIKVMRQGKDLYFLEVHTFGACHSGLVMNNGNLFKCGMNRPKDITRMASLQNTEGMMQYHWGTAAALVKTLRNDDKLGPCNRNVLNAKFAHGRRPSSFIYQNGTMLQAVVVNEGVNFLDVPQISVLVCGAPLKTESNRGSLVFQRFEVVPYELLDVMRDLQ